MWPNALLLFPLRHYCHYSLVASKVLVVVLFANCQQQQHVKNDVNLIYQTINWSNDIGRLPSVSFYCLGLGVGAAYQITVDAVWITYLFGITIRICHPSHMTCVLSLGTQQLFTHKMIIMIISSFWNHSVLYWVFVQYFNLVYGNLI